jgi:hypothetical protein
MHLSMMRHIMQNVSAYAACGALISIAGSFFF